MPVSYTHLAWAAHIPGVKVVVPSTAGECKGLLKTAIRDNDPVMFFEHKMLYTTKFNDVPEVEEDVCIPFGRARICLLYTSPSVWLSFLSYSWCCISL